MSSNSKVTPDTRRRTLIGLAGLAASASAWKTAWGAEPGPFAIKRASLLQRKPGITHGYPMRSSSSIGWKSMHRWPVPARGSAATR